MTLKKGGSEVTGYSNHISGDDVYQKIKEDILTLKLKPGQMISENEIANIYNVSRTPIKNAFLRLKGEQYIEIVPQKGSFVTLLDIRNIRDVIYMRALLELDMLNTIIDEGLTEKAVAGLRANLEEQYKLINSENLTPSSYYIIDNAFHYSLFRIVGRESMWDVIQNYQVYFARFRILDAMTTGRYEDVCLEHDKIIKALEDMDRAKLKKSVMDHLHSGLHRLDAKIKGEFKEFFIQAT